MNTSHKPPFTREQIRQLTQRSNWRGAWAVFSTWALIAASFALLATWTNPLTFIVALVLLGGRQLALAILQHEAAHGTLFKNRRANRLIGDWLCARPIWLKLENYRLHHMKHHKDTGVQGDPDLSLTAPFPGTSRSLRRKLLRDISGLTGLKFLLGWVLMDAGVLKWTVSADMEKLPQDGRRWYHYVRDFCINAAPTLIVNAALFGILAASGHAWLYAVWVLAYLTPYPLFLRIRSIAEHACLEATRDPYRNTRTTRAGLLARLTVAPMHVNYHLEHHLLASVPYWNLPKMHRMLREQGRVAPAPGYLDVLRLAGSAPA